jgi:hypothetical protein
MLLWVPAGTPVQATLGENAVTARTSPPMTAPLKASLSPNYHSIGVNGTMIKVPLCRVVEG